MSSWMADAHNDWHTANRDNPQAICPLDCGYNEPAPDEDYRYWYESLTPQERAVEDAENERIAAEFAARQAEREAAYAAEAARYGGNGLPF